MANLLFLPHRWYGKKHEFSIGEIDVLESSSFKGNPLYWGGWWVKGPQHVNVVKHLSSF